MARDGLNDADIARILRQTRRIALVGASNRPDRPSHGVMRFLLGQGWTVVPVNPGLAGQTLLGQLVVASLKEACPLDMVDIFRASDQAGAVVTRRSGWAPAACGCNLASSIWRRPRRARGAGLDVVMDAARPSKRRGCASVQQSWLDLAARRAMSLPE